MGISPCHSSAFKPPGVAVDTAGMEYTESTSIVISYRANLLRMVFAVEQYRATGILPAYVREQNADAAAAR